MSYRHARQIDMTPWCAEAVGPHEARLPKGYRLMGHASSNRTTYGLVLWRFSGEAPWGGKAWESIAERNGQLAEVRPAFDSLVDIAWIDARERNCAICGRRPPELNVTLGDRIVGICDTCYERGREAAESPREDVPA